jgi:hypothetical protein
MARRFTLASYAALVVGFALALWGGFLGYAASATNHYGWLLRPWAIATGLALSLFAAVAIADRSWRRFAAIFLGIATLVAGYDPLSRLLFVGWSAP